MIFRIQFQIDVPSQQKAVSLRDRVVTYLEEQGATVTHQDSAKVTETYLVHGWDETTAGKFSEQVEATSKLEAATLVATATRHPVKVELFSEASAPEPEAPPASEPVVE